MRPPRFERKWKSRLLAFMKERVNQIMRTHVQAGARDGRLARDGAIGTAW